MDESSALRVAGQCEGLLLRGVFAPLATALGPMGDVALTSVVSRMVEGGHDGFTRALARVLERSHA
ncbi:MAG: hypothetical protein ACYDG8_08125 [Vulcanimicrobiaceae bacterium]